MVLDMPAFESDGTAIRFIGFSRARGRKSIRRLMHRPKAEQGYSIQHSVVGKQRRLCLRNVGIPTRYIIMYIFGADVFNKQTPGAIINYESRPWHRKCSRIVHREIDA